MMIRANWDAHDQRLATLQPHVETIIRHVYSRTNDEMQHRGITLRCYCAEGKRSREDQLADFDAGRSKTKTGKHPEGLAADTTFIRVSDEEVLWDYKGEGVYARIYEAFELLHEIAGEEGLRHLGMEWDPYHLEYVEQDTLPGIAGIGDDEKEAEIMADKEVGVPSLAETIEDGLTLDEVKVLEFGPDGYQNEPGFEFVLDDEAVPGGVAPIPLLAVLCRSDKHRVEQLRYLSVHELLRGVIEIADTIAGVRINVAGSPRSILVVGRKDDIIEVGKKAGRGHALRFGLLGVARLVSFIARLPDLLRGAIAKVRL